MTVDDRGIGMGQRSRRRARALEQHHHIHRTDVRSDRSGLLGAGEQPLEHPEDLAVRRADLLAAEPCLVHRLEQRTVELLASDDVGDEVEQRLPGIRGIQELPTADRGVMHPFGDDRRDQVLLRGEVPKQGSAPEACGPCDLRDADVEPSLAEQPVRSFEQTLAVALGVGPKLSLLYGHLAHIVLRSGGGRDQVGLDNPDVASAQRQRQRQPTGG